MNKVFLSIPIVLAFAIAGFGQKDQKDRNRQIALSSGTAIEAQLEKTVDVRSAKVGDQVGLKTTKSVKQNGEVIIPAGSRLIGRITDVQQRSKDNSQSRIGMIFERVQGSGLSAPFSASVVSITSAATNVAAGDSLMSDTSTSTQSSGTVSPRGGGGLLGAAGHTVGGLVNTTTQVAGGVTNTVTQTAGTGTGMVGRTLSGIQISTSASGSANSSTTLSSPNKNLRVEKGATFNLRADGNMTPRE